MGDQLNGGPVDFDMTAGEFAFHLRREEVCVNPYHYTKVNNHESDHDDYDDDDDDDDDDNLELK